TIKVQETATNEAGAASAATSAATAAVIIAPPASKTPPTISGTPQQGQTLTEAHGEWENSPASYTYQWLQCDSSGANCKAITGATNQSYIAAGGDIGHTLRVREAASNGGGTSSPATSEASALIKPAAPALLEAPKITGTAKQGETLEE